jgi:formate hydrogenlyase subunit 4
LGRFFTVAAALDTGSAFEGMGGAREVTFSCLTEPALFFGLIVLTRLSGSLSLSTMFGQGLGQAWQHGGASLVLVGVSLFIVLLAETCRIPVDDPNTHLELTMIHEVMVLDHGGPALGLIEYAAALKLFVLGALVVRIAIPYSGNPWAAWGIFAGSMMLLAVLIGVVESSMARLRLAQVPILLVAACLLSAFGIVLVAR